MTVNIKKLTKTANVPTKGTAGSAGFDLCADLGKYDVCTIPPHETVMIGTGIAAAIPKGFFGAVFARSGLASKKGLRPANCVGVIDSDYRGEIKVALFNDSTVHYGIQNGERIAQLVIIPCAEAELAEVTDLEGTERGEGGFGSTGAV